MKFPDRPESSARSAIRLIDVAKKFRLFSKKSDRLKEALFPFGKPRHAPFWALKDITFDVPGGKSVGIMGRNGSGKSTLLEIIASVRQPSGGSVFVNGRVATLLELGAGFHPELTGRANVMLSGITNGFSRPEMKARMAEIEAYADIGKFFDQPVKYYSSGMFVRAAFAAAIHIEPDILLVDEALSVGDGRFQHKCCQSFRGFLDAGKTLLLVSHDTDLLQRLCDLALVLEKGKLFFVGPIREGINKYHGLLHGNEVPDEAGAGTPQNRHGSAPGAGGKPAAPGQEIYPSPASHLISGQLGDNCPNRSNYNKAETRMGDGRVVIIDYCLAVNDSIDPAVIESGRRLSIFIKLLFNKKLSDVSVGFAVVSKEGIGVCGTNLFLLEKPLLSGGEKEILIARYDLMASFTGGDYFLNLGCNMITREKDIFLDVRRSIAHFRIADTKWCTGLAALPSNFSVEWRGSGSRAEGRSDLEPIR